MVSPRAAATGCAVCTARRCGLLTRRVIGKRAKASGSRLACSIPTSDKSGSEPSPGSLRCGNACRMRSNCTVTPYGSRLGDSVLTVAGSERIQLIVRRVTGGGGQAERLPLLVGFQ